MLKKSKAVYKMWLWCHSALFCVKA